ncbi:MAG: Flagellar basal body P-ring protein FlgI [Candidatus Midichloria mitochondrii]
MVLIFLYKIYPSYSTRFRAFVKFSQGQLKGVKLLAKLKNQCSTFNISLYLLGDLAMNFCTVFCALFLFVSSFTQFASAESRIKDIVNFEGIRDNILVGYGLVVGLNGSGDNLKNSAFTEKGLVDFLERLGINSRGSNLKTKNIAAVMVTATISAFARTGSKISVSISTLGDAKSLKGGTLIATPLLGADGEVYAVAQGPVSIGSLADPDPSKIKAVPTSGYVNNGAIIEKEINFSLKEVSEMRLALKNPDITTARTIATAINNAQQDDLIASVEDPGTIKVNVPNHYRDNAVNFLAEIENLTIQPDQVAKIVIDETTGTIVISENVKINTVAVAQGNLRVKITDQEGFVQSLRNAAKSKKELDEEQRADPGTNLAVLENGTNLSDLVNGLNALAVKTHDLVAILKTIQQAGALQAEIEVR